MIAALYAAISGLMLIALSVHVVRSRTKHGTALGDSNELELTRRIRAQANFVEYAPLFLVLLTLSELQGMPKFAIHVFGVAFLVGRAMHAYSLLRAEQYVNGKLSKPPIWRMAGMVATFSSIGLLALTLLTQFATH